MSTPRPFAYNTGAPISGTTQYGTLIVGDIDVEYSADYGGVKWWGGANEELGFVIAQSVPTGQPVPSGVTGTANVGFLRSKLLTSESFLNLANYVGAKNGQLPFTTSNQAQNWLNNNGYWSSYPVPSETYFILFQDNAIMTAQNGDGIEKQY
jgi:hypothetical protein